MDQIFTEIRGRFDPKTGTLLQRGAKSQMFWQMVKLGYPQDMYTDIQARAWAAKMYQVGNCGEQAAIAFLFLETITSAPLDYMEFGNTPTYDHDWVVIGRVSGSDPYKVRTWGAEAVWCDPWQLREGRVYSIDDLIKKKATNLDSAFKLSSEELVNAGLPNVLYRRH